MGYSGAPQDEVVRRDPHAVYHPTTLAKVGAPWVEIFGSFSLPDSTKVNENDPAYYEAVRAALRNGTLPPRRELWCWAIAYPPDEMIDEDEG